MIQTKENDFNHGIQKIFCIPCFNLQFFIVLDSTLL
jgi:hypothetical protein